MKRNHSNGEDVSNRSDKGKKSLNKNAKAKNTNVTIPCDVCSFVGKTAAEYMKHIEDHNKEKAESILPCELCDYKARSAQSFKLHIETAHGIKVKDAINKDAQKPDEEFRFAKSGGRKVKLGLCVFWNQGFCKYDALNCRFEHKNISPCRYQERCNKPDCKFYHDASLGKFLFLGSRTRTFQSPQLQPRYRHHQQAYQAQQSRGQGQQNGRF